MQIDSKELRRLSNLEISRYAGQLDAIRGKDEILVGLLAETPVEVVMVAEEGVCNGTLYNICKRRTGRHKSFALLRGEVIGELAQRFEPPCWNLLSVLFDGIYVGEPEDLYNLRAGEPQGVIYNLKGLGTKLADVKFLKRE